ncbi:hypothetical protein ACF06P_09070 [Streptomyces sp. NPDC015684]|uniref:hypothetical protein n=1 Tax=Streptomyces sp. NPDC015684 TaxID=3364963 RepID=UPI0036F6FEE9
MDDLGFSPLWASGAVDRSERHNVTAARIDPLEALAAASSRVIERLARRLKANMRRRESSLRR